MNPISRQRLLYLVVFVMVELMAMAVLDRPLALAMHRLDETHKPIIDIFRLYTDYAKGFWYLWPSGILVIICFLLARSRGLSKSQRAEFLTATQRFAFFFASVALSGLLTDGLKRIVGRGRPVLLFKSDFYGFHPNNFGYAYNSFPSGHATTAAAVACAIALLFPKTRVFCALFALCFLLSRVMVNAHFLSDVLAGAALGILVTLWIKGIFTRKGWWPGRS